MTLLGEELLPKPDSVSGVENYDGTFRCIQVKEHLSLLPCYVGNISQGVISYLNNKILKNSSQLNGVLLSYSKPVLLQKEGRILDELPHIHFDLSYTAYVFRPLLGSVLHGSVNKIGNDHVGCLLYDCFNVSIVKKEKRHSDGFSSSYKKLKIGTEISFKVLSIDRPISSDVLSLVGELESKKLKKSSHRKRKRPPEED